ncbi:3'-5' exonuclease [Dactylosporangium sp. CS-033363]|uniref:3'-5' exonuclease n=1 Tax=Dactylosporangium sp. CS-033363 TaxID=3239935 RepID=UPI003D89E155
MHDAAIAEWSARPWRAAPLVAFDLEGTGAQDGADEAILELAAIRLRGGLPDLATAYTTVVNPGRTVPRRAWISPGLTGDVLASAPRLDAVEPGLAARLDGCILVGHNIGVDWRLLHRRCPTVAPAALLDTLKLAGKLAVPGSHSLTALLDTLDLTTEVDAAGSRPHRALWDAAGAAVLLRGLISRSWSGEPTLGEVLTVAHRPHKPPDTLF